MSVFGIVLLAAIMGFTITQGRRDVIFTVFGYLAAAFAISLILFFGVLYFYTHLFFSLLNR